NQSDVMSLAALNPSEVTNRLKLTAGRLPSAQSANIEIALEAASAELLHVSPGDSLAYLPPSGTSAPALTMQVVGIFTVLNRADPYWGDLDFSTGQFNGATSTGTAYTAIATVDTLMTHADQVQALSGDNAAGPAPANMQWRFNLDYSR